MDSIKLINASEIEQTIQKDIDASDGYFTKANLTMFQDYIKGVEPVVDLSSDLFGCVLNCAVRYCIGRQTYMPSVVIGEITPLLPYLNNRTLWCFDQDITEARYEGGYGDPQIDEPHWMRFHELVREERTKRGEKLYKTWRQV